MNERQAREHYSPDNYAKVLERSREIATDGCIGTSLQCCSDVECPLPIERWCEACCLGFLIEAHERSARLEQQIARASQ